MNFFLLWCYLDYHLILLIPSKKLACYMKKNLLILSVIIALFSCTPEERKNRIRIATNPWPGYEFLHLAEHLGYFEQVGLNVELVQLASLSDVQQAYTQGVVDGFTSTLVEVVLVTELTEKEPTVVLIPDYSNGGDVILANASIPSFSELKNKVVGAEIASLGIFVLKKSLEKNGMSIDDIELVNVEQSEGKRMLDSGMIEAFVSYPPFSIDIEKSENYHIIFDTSEIPNQVIDTVSLSKSIIRDNPEVTDKLHQAWQLALDFERINPEKAHQIMAARQRITVEEFKSVLTDIVVLNVEKQRELFKNLESLSDSALNVCEALNKSGTLSTSCEKTKNMFRVN